MDAWGYPATRVAVASSGTYLYVLEDGVLSEHGLSGTETTKGAALRTLHVPGVSNIARMAYCKGQLCILTSGAFSRATIVVVDAVTFQVWAPFALLSR